MPLKKSDALRIVLRYVDTFNKDEMKYLRGYVDGKLGPVDVVNPAGNAYPIELQNFAGGEGGKLEKKGSYIYIVKAGKAIYKVDYAGNVTKPRGKKILYRIFYEKYTSAARD